MNVIQESTTGGNLGSSFATGISAGLQNLLNNKLGQIQQQQQQMKTAQGLKAFFPNTKADELQQLAGLPPEILNVMVKQKAQELGNMDFANALGQGQQQAPQQQISPLEQLLGSSEGFSPQQMEQVQAQESSLAQPQIQGQPKAASTLSRYEDILRNPKLKPEHRLKIEKMAQQERLAEKKEAKEEIREGFKETKEFRKEIREKAKVARDQLQDLDRLEELEKEGKLDTPGYFEHLKRSGMDIPALMNEGSEEYNKIVNNFTRNAKSYFGSRISNFEIEQFLKTLPSLSASPAGRNRIISNLKRINRVELEYNNAMKEVLSENKGVPPLDLAERVDDKIEKKLDAISNQFKKDLNKPVPKGQNKYITYLQAATGSLLGAPGKLIGSVGGALSKLAA